MATLRRAMTPMPTMPACDGHCHERHDDSDGQAAPWRFCPFCGRSLPAPARQARQRRRPTFREIRALYTQGYTLRQIATVFGYSTLESVNHIVFDEQHRWYQRSKARVLEAYRQRGGTESEPDWDHANDTLDVARAKYDAWRAVTGLDVLEPYQSGGYGGTRKWLDALCRERLPGPFPTWDGLPDEGAGPAVSVRVLNCLARNKLSLPDAARLSDAELLTIPNMGKGGVAEIRAALA